MRTVTLAALLLAAPLAAVAQTDEISYDILDFQYLRTEVDSVGPDIDGSGLGFSGSVEIRKNLHLAAALISGEFDAPNSDQLDKSFGIGAHFKPGVRWSAFGQVGFLDTDIDLLGNNYADDGYYGLAGIRYVPAPGYELRAEFKYVDFDVLGSDSIPTIAGDISLTDVIALTIGYTEDDEVSSLAIGMRFYFGKNAPKGFRE